MLAAHEFLFVFYFCVCVCMILKFSILHLDFGVLVVSFGKDP